MMKMHEIVIIAIVLTLFLAPCNDLFAQKSSCGEIDAMARMAHAISSGELAANRSKAGESYRARVIFAEMEFEFYPQKHDVALLLLNLIPKDDDERHAVMTLGDHLCDFETPHEMKSLNQIGNHLPRDLAKAVLVAPEKLPEYVAYSIASVKDPHSDYALQMQKVCRARHTEFVEAIAKMPAEEMEEFLKYVFNPDGCDALALPEGE
ncbi:MAG: hypothetical protein WAK26_10285 [Terracidiphilus sp.]